MRIRKIDLVGFKSFADKTTLVLDEDLTAIVGPNGCGKSNVVDALRWVMGSQSAKQLRGDSMESVIFAGTQARGPMGMAEVAFTLDLSDGVAPPQYEGYREVEVVRRLFRDGTSEYYIQKVPCRLQDVRELFLGTGVGPNAYAIIEQGKIGEVVGAKPETRRGFIEEAAGITKYKDKKRKAELKMASTRQNLLRIGDIVSELESSMRRLWRAAKRAERYEAYRDEVADLDKWRICQALLENMTARRMAETNLERLSGTVAEVDALIAEREARLEAERLEIRDLEVALSDRQSALANLNNRVKLLEAQAEHKRQEMKELERRADLDEAEADRLERRAAAQEAEREETQARLAQLETDLEAERERLRAAEQALEAAREQADEVVGRLEEDREEARRTDARVAALEASRRSAAERVEEATARLEELAVAEQTLAERQESLEPKLTALEARLETARTEKQERLARQEQLADQLESLQQDVARLEVEVDTVRGQLQRNRSRLTSLEEIQRRYEGFQQGTRAIMENGESLGDPNAIHGVLADLVEAPPELEAAVEAVLGERLGAIVVEDPEVGLQGVSFLKEGNRGRSSFLPVRGSEPPAEAALSAGGEGAPVAGTSVGGGAAGGNGGTGAASFAAGFESGSDVEITNPAVRGLMLDHVKVSGDYGRVASRLLQDVIVVEDLRHAVSVWRTQRRPRTVVTLDGEVVDVHGVISGGSRDAQSAGILAQKREIRELTEICADLEAHYEALREQLVGAKQALRETEQEVETLRRELHDLEMGILGDTKDLDAARAQIEETRARAVDARSEMARLEALVADLTAQQQQADVELDELLVSQGSLAERLSLGGAQADRAREAVSRLAAEVAERRVTVARVAEQCHTARRDVERLGAESAQARERLAALRAGAEESRARVSRLAEEVARADEERLALSSEAMDLSEAVSEQAAACEARRMTLAEMEAGLKRLRDDRRGQADEREELRMRVVSLKKDWENLAARLDERHHVTPEEVLHEYHLRPVFDEELQERLAKQSRVLESLRNTYNPGARQEYEELKERHEFLSSQKADLEEALDRLEKAIQKINRTSRARFRVAFEGINQEFQAVFPRLFKGGKARLELTQSNDILNAGVEIIAQPPGKKLQSVDIMSGGEKALTAVALLFAIFRYRPSPFCLLDEVDAPLDDANVDRFNEMVREMAGETQFLIITHNKRTMAMADALYGVTMEEPGCSKVVAVNFKEASRMVDEPPPAGGPGGPGSRAPAPASDSGAEGAGPVGSAGSAASGS